MNRLQVLLAVCFFIAWVFGGYLFARKTSSPSWLGVQVPSPTQGNVVRGKAIYQAHCASCHGIKGDGNGPHAIHHDPKPRDFRSGEYKFKTTLSDESPTDADLYRTITVGMRGTGMQGWSKLSSADRWNVIAYIKTFAIDRSTKKNIFALRPARHVLAIKEPAVNLEDAAKRGRLLFLGKAKCNDCHGPGLKSRDGLPRGDGEYAFGLVDDWGNPIRPTDLAGGILKRGNSPREIYVTITTGLMGTPMPTYEDNLTDEERWDIAFYVSKLKRCPGQSRRDSPGRM